MRTSALLVRSRPLPQRPQIRFAFVPAGLWIFETQNFIVHVALVKLHEIERRAQLGCGVARSTILPVAMRPSDQELIQVSEQPAATNARSVVELARCILSDRQSIVEKREVHAG